MSLRAIAARAGVNYDGIVYRHFRTKEAVIRAAMDSVVPRSTGAHPRLLAWAILQYLVDDIMPAEDPFLQRLRLLAKAGLAETSWPP